MNALKCDRCKRYYDYDPTVRYNYISFGHKDIIPNKKQITKDICPECMEKFIDWLENSFDPETCNREKCKGCKDFGWVAEDVSSIIRDDEKAIWGYYTCNMMNKKVKNPYIESAFAAMVTPKMFLDSDDIFRDDDERVNELYKEAEDISNSAGEEKVE